MDEMTLSVGPVDEHLPGAPFQLEALPKTPDGLLAPEALDLLADRAAVESTILAAGEEGSQERANAIKAVAEVDAHAKQWVFGPEQAAQAARAGREQIAANVRSQADGLTVCWEELTKLTMNEADRFEWTSGEYGDFSLFRVDEEAAGILTKMQRGLPLTVEDTVRAQVVLGFAERYAMVHGQASEDSGRRKRYDNSLSQIDTELGDRYNKDRAKLANAVDDRWIEPEESEFPETAEQVKRRGAAAATAHYEACAEEVSAESDLVGGLEAPIESVHEGVQALRKAVEGMSGAVAGLPDGGMLQQTARYAKDAVYRAVRTEGKVVEEEAIVSALQRIQADIAALRSGVVAHRQRHEEISQALGHLQDSLTLFYKTPIFHQYGEKTNDGKPQQPLMAA